MIRAVLFDWDGTLVDTGDVLLSCWYHMSETVLGRRVPGNEEERKFLLSMRAREAFPHLTDDPEQLRRIFEEFDIAYARNGAADAKAMRGAHALIESLRDAGIKTAIVTSKTTFCTEVDMHATGLDGMFDVVMTGDDVTQPKPHPEGALRVMETLGVTPHETVFVGDTATDVRAGKGAGAWTIGLTHGLGGDDPFRDVEPDRIYHELPALQQAISEGLFRSFGSE